MPLASLPAGPKQAGVAGRKAFASEPPLSRAVVSAWLIAALLLFLLQILPSLSYRWVTDESWYAATAYSIFQGHGFANPAIGPNDLENHFDARPPGTALVIAAAFRLFGAGLVSARLGSIVSGILIVCFTFRLACHVIGSRAALLATFLVASDYLVVLTSRTARPEALTAMAVLAALLAMMQYALNGRIRWAIACGLIMALGTMFHVILAGFIVSLAILAMAIDRRRGAYAFKGATSFALAYLLGLLPFTVWILTAPLGRAGFVQEFLNRASRGSLWPRFLHEGKRYYDLLGLLQIHAYGLDAVPVRLPLPLLILVSFLVLYKLQRRWFYLALILLIPSLLWFMYTVNKTSRYTALLSPVFAFAIAAAVASSRHKPKLYRFLFFSSMVVIVAQLSANLVLLRKARYADYNQVTYELRKTIPTGQAAYGSITFWMALRDHPYISYERTGPWMAAQQFHVRYFIVGDRVFSSGVPGDEVFYQRLRYNMGKVIAQSALLAEYKSAYYGDLKVYQLVR